MKGFEINQQMAREQGNVTLTHFSSSNWFCCKSLSYSNFCRCSNTAMINQCFGNMKQDQIWSYDDLMIWWYDDTRIWSSDLFHVHIKRRDNWHSPPALLDFNRLEKWIWWQIFFQIDISDPIITSWIFMVRNSEIALCHA